MESNTGVIIFLIQKILIAHHGLLRVGQRSVTKDNTFHKRNKCAKLFSECAEKIWWCNNIVAR